MTIKTETFFQRITKKYRLTVSENENYADVYKTSVTKLKVFLLAFVLFLLGITLTVLVLFYTPLRQVVPGYPSNQMRKLIVYNNLMVDSLNIELAKRDSFVKYIQHIIEGDIIHDTTSHTSHEYSETELKPENTDSVINELIGPEKFRFNYSEYNENADILSQLNFFSPISGVVVNKFNNYPGHLGTDIVGIENAKIKAILNGVVVFAEWSVSTGYVVQIQHNHNLLSIYKHNSDVLVKPGEHVKAGDLIAIMGDEGELSTGPHLHFELWQNGVPLDPEKYIAF